MLDLKFTQAIKNESLNSLDDLHDKEQQRIFEVLYQSVEITNELTAEHGFITRRASMHCISNLQPSSSHERPCRRHSSFHSRNRQAHRIDHSNIEEHLLQQRNRELTCRVNNLLNFHSSFEISLEASSWHESIPALHFSCPVLSYMHDSDEDSIEIRMAKRPSLISVTNGSRNFENLNDISVDDPVINDISVDNPVINDISADNPVIITFDLNDQLTEPVNGTQTLNTVSYSSSRHGKRRNRLSYARLERRLATESHLTVFKSLIGNDIEDMTIEIPMESF